MHVGCVIIVIELQLEPRFGVGHITVFNRRKETGNSRILMHHLAVAMSRQAMKGGQHSDLG